MFDEEINIKNYFKALFFYLLISIIILFLFAFSKKELKVVFCDVGQGDATYLRWRNIDILIDGGPDRKVLNCLGKYMPFYDRKIEFLILSHPQKDHFNGFNYIVDRYQVEMFISSVFSFKKEYQNFLKKLKEKKVIQKQAKAGEKIIIGKNLIFKFLWPKENLNSSFFDINDRSLIFLFSYKNFDILFTGDVSIKSLSFLKKEISFLAKNKIEVLKVPHHGSKNSLNYNLLSLIDPLICVISVGKNNYGHPANELLTAIKKLRKKYLRTDENGYIWIEVNKKGWQIKWGK